MSAENGMTTMSWPVLFTTTGNRIITPMKYLEMEKSIERKREKERERKRKKEKRELPSNT